MSPCLTPPFSPWEIWVRDYLKRRLSVRELIFLSFHQIFLLARDWSKCVRWLNIHQHPRACVRACCEKYLKDNKRNSLHLAWKYARIFVLGHCSSKFTVFWERSSRKSVGEFPNEAYSQGYLIPIKLFRNDLSGPFKIRPLWRSGDLSLSTTLVYLHWSRAQNLLSSFIPFCRLLAFLRPFRIKRKIKIIVKWWLKNGRREKAKYRIKAFKPFMYV